MSATSQNNPASKGAPWRSVAAWVAMGLAIASGCGKAASDGAPGGVSPTAAAAAPEPAPSRSPVELSGGDLLATVAFTPAQPKVGELFAASTTLRRTDGTAVTATSFALDATMPSHGHGMMTDPKHEATAGGWSTSGMKLHMHGAWKLAVDATVDGKVVHLEADWQQAPEAL